jgi:hypothetical protein
MSAMLSICAGIEQNLGCVASHPSPASYEQAILEASEGPEELGSKACAEYVPGRRTLRRINHRERLIHRQDAKSF